MTQRSIDRILTTHTGSLPRPEDLVELMFAKLDGRSVDENRLADRIASSVDEIVERQAAMGIDYKSDGEMGKPSYASYVVERLSGFEGQSELPRLADLLDYPAVAERCFDDPGNQHTNANRPACNGPVALKDDSGARTDIANFERALARVDGSNGFMTAASPGLIAMFLGNTYYESDEEFLYAIAEGMRSEYEAIVEAGFVLQLDCPDLAMARHREFAGEPLSAFRDYMKLHIDVLNTAVAAIPPDRMRMHLCWGNYPGPHHHDVPFEEIVDLVLTARPAALAFEAANPRHEHEWRVFEHVELPEGKTLIPGVIDSVSNCIEHPELIGDRIVRYANVVGRENVMAGSDCGFGTFVGVKFVDPDIAWAKLEALVQGAEIASSRLWN